MASGEFSFDVVSQYDRQELVNAVDQTHREMTTRYDLKSTKSEMTLEKDRIVVTTESEFLLKSIVDVLQTKVIRRDLSLKILDYGKVEQASGGSVRQAITLRQGIADELAKKITKLIRDRVPKVKTQIQGDAVRVSAKSKDDLQAVIKLLKEQDYPVPLQFINYR